MTELAAPQISSLMEALPGIAQVLRSPVASAMVDLVRSGAGLGEFKIEDAEELLRFGVRRNLLDEEEVERLLAEVREATKGSRKAPVKAEPARKAAAGKKAAAKPAAPTKAAKQASAPRKASARKGATAPKSKKAARKTAAKKAKPAKAAKKATKAAKARKPAAKAKKSAARKSTKAKKRR